MADQMSEQVGEAIYVLGPGGEWPSGGALFRSAPGPEREPAWTRRCGEDRQHG